MRHYRSSSRGSYGRATGGNYGRHCRSNARGYIKLHSVKCNADSIRKMTAKQHYALMRKQVAKIMVFLAVIVFASISYLALLLLPLHLIWLKFGYFNFISNWCAFGYSRRMLHKYMLPTTIVVVVVTVAVRMFIFWLFGVLLN